MTAPMTPERLAEARVLLRYESSVSFHSARAKESMLLLLAEAEEAARLRARVDELVQQRDDLLVEDARAEMQREPQPAPVPLVVSRFDVAMEPAPEEPPVLTIGAVAEDRRPVALLLDPEARAKVAGWLGLDRGAVLREVADDWVSRCPEHSDAEEVWMDCPCEWADELRRVAAAEDAAEGETGGAR